MSLSASDEVRQVTNALDTREDVCDLEKGGTDGNQIGVSSSGNSLTAHF